MLWPWSELGLSGPAGAEEIKHAYAKRLKEVHPEEDPEGFQRLHRAYQVARRLARVSGRPADPQIGREEPKNDDTEQPEDSKTDTAALETAAAQEETQEEPTAEGGEAPPDSEAESWDFETLLAQGVQETELEEAPQEEEASAWVPPVSGKPKRRRWRDLSAERQINIIFIILLAALLVLAIAQGLPGQLFSQSSAARAEETRAWLEETFQMELISSPHNKDREEDRFLYWLEDAPDIRFQAISEGDGVYHTNFPSAMLFAEMKAFAQAWPDYPLWFDTAMMDSAGIGAEVGSPPWLFLFQIPLEGAEGFLEALGSQLEQLAQTDWYIKQPPEYVLALAHGEAILQSYDSTAGEILSGEELLTFYRESLCGYLLEDLLFQRDVALWDFPDDDNLIWAKTGPGSVLDADGYWITCYGTGRDGGDLIMYYFLREDYTALYCIPGELMDQAFTLSCIETLTMSCGRQIEVYRVL